MYEMLVMQNMSDQQRLLFMSQMSSLRKDGTVGVLLALFLGGFGAHRFYLGQVGLGILYIVFSWTFIPSVVSFVECFFMPGRVRAYNDLLAQRVATEIVGLAPVAP